MLYSKIIMPTKTAPVRYHQRPKDIRKQLPYLVQLAIIYLIMAIFVSGFHDTTVRMVLHCILLASLAFIFLLILFTSLPKINYFQLDSNGFRATLLGFIHRHIHWSDIERIDKAPIGNVEGLGLMYKPSINHYVFGRKTRRRLFGWDEMLADAYSADGSSLLKGTIKSYEAYCNRNK